MKKFLALSIIALFLICPILASHASATTVFLTSDDVLGHEEDMNMLYEIKDDIERKSNGRITVVVDSEASSPGEGTRAMNADCDVAVSVAYACAGNLKILADYSAKTTKTIIYVNSGGLDLNNINFLRRSYDDDWSDSSFAAIQQPGKFLTDSGVILLQPGQDYPDETNNGNMEYSSSEINEYIADTVINAVNTGSTSNRQFDSDLIVTHKLDPKYLAEDSQKIAASYGGDMEESYGSYTTPQLLYMSASYIAGYSLDVPGNFEAPDNPLNSSILTKDSYSFNDYYNMADIVVDYMREHGKAPDYIEYEGALIGYYDLVYNFALLCQDDTDSSHMNFEGESKFYKFHDNKLLGLLPIAVFIVLIIIIAVIIRRIRKSRKNRRPRARHNQRNYRSSSNQPRRLNRKRR